MTDPQTPPPPRPSRAPAGPVVYKGEPLDAGRGPGLGCFWSQVVLLVIALVLAPLSVSWGWPTGVSFFLFFLVMILLLFSGQTVIFLLRLVAAERRGRRRPLGQTTPTVGQIEDAAAPDPAAEGPDGPSHGPGDPGVRE